MVMIASVAHLALLVVSLAVLLGELVVHRQLVGGERLPLQIDTTTCTDITHIYLDT